MRRTIGFAVLVLLALAGLFLKYGGQPPSSGKPQAPPASTETPPKKADSGQRPSANPGRGYVLALTWSPAFCETRDPGGEDSEQCAIGARKGLMLHGLWPDGPAEFCPSSEPERLPDSLARRVKGFMPSVGLARHEWEKHGTCSGMDRETYFRTAETAWRAFARPASLDRARGRTSVERNDFLAEIVTANPGIPRDGIALQCGRGGLLSEIRVCLDGNLKPRSCTGNVRRSCPASLTILPPR